MGSASAGGVAAREAVEAQIADETQRLLQIVQLLQEQAPFREWPEDALLVLRAALTEEGSPIEAQKARTLERHLFRGKDVPIDPLRGCELPPTLHRAVERIRGDLAGLVPLGAGLRCVLHR